MNDFTPDNRYLANDDGTFHCIECAGDLTIGRMHIPANEKFAHDVSHDPAFQFDFGTEFDTDENRAYQR